MAIYKLRAPNGKDYSFEGPAGATHEDQVDVLLHYFPEANGPDVTTTERTWGEALSDPVQSVKKGAGELLKFPGQLYGVATGAISEPDFTDTGLYGVGKRLSDSAQEQKSLGLKNREAASQARVAEADKEGFFSGAGQQIKEIATDPAQLPNFLLEQSVQSLPSILLALFPVVGAAGAAELKGLQIAAKAAEAVGNQVAKKEAMDAIAKIAVNAGTRQAVGIGAVQQGADIGAGTYEEMYKGLIKNNVPQPEAAQQAVNAAREAGLSAAALSVLVNKLGGNALEKTIAGRSSGITGRGRSAVGVGLKEGISEVPEEAGGKAIQNYEYQAVDPNRSIMEGLGSTAGQAFIGGAGLGAAAGAATGNKAEEDVAKQTPEQIKMEEERLAAIARIESEMQQTQVPPADVIPPVTEDATQPTTEGEKPVLALPAPAQKIPDDDGVTPETYKAVLDALKNEDLTGLKPEELHAKIQDLIKDNYGVPPSQETAQTIEAESPEAPPQAGIEPVAPPVLPPVAPPAPPPEVTYYGKDNIPLNEGGEGFATRSEAQAARALQPQMRVVIKDGAHYLTDKSPAQLAAEEQAAKRFRTAGASPAGAPIPAHAFIADLGGMSRATMPDLGFDSNLRLRGKWLFGSAGMSVELATERLKEAGYLPKDADNNAAIELIKKSVTNPQYTPEGWERIAGQGMEDAQQNFYGDEPVDPDADIPFDEPGTPMTEADLDKYFGPDVRGKAAKKAADKAAKEQQKAAEAAAKAQAEALAIRKAADATTILNRATREGVFSPPSAKPPAGFEIKRELFKTGEEPGEFTITDGETSIPFQGSLEEAKAKMARIQSARDRKAKELQQKVDSHTMPVKKALDKVETLEADGQYGTEAHKQAVAALELAKNKSVNSAFGVENKIAAISQPFRLEETGKRPTTRESHTVYKDGQEIGAFPTVEAAQDHVLANADEASLQGMIDSKHSWADRVTAEQQRRTATNLETGEVAGKVNTPISDKTQQAITGEPAPEEPAPGPSVEEQLERKAKIENIGKWLTPTMKKMGLGNVSLQIVEALDNGADGSYAANAIKLAMDSNNPLRDLKHESVHALKELGFFTPQQWEALVRQAKQTWINTYLKGVVHNETQTRHDAYMADFKSKGMSEAAIQEAMIEEAIADAFANFDGPKKPSGMIAALINRLRQFFASIKSAMTGAGWESAEQVFTRAAEGELRSSPENVAKPAKQDKMSLPQNRRDTLAQEYYEYRKTDPARASAAFKEMSAIDAKVRAEAEAEDAAEGMPKFSLRSAPNTPEFKRWFSGSKVVDANGKPLVVYHGSGEAFNEFDVGRIGENTGYGDAEVGFHFSDNNADADFYATKAASRLGTKPVVRKFYLSLQNPLVVGFDESDGNAGDKTQDFLDDKIAAKEYAVENGYDGIVYPYGTNVDSGYTAIAFNPTQVKSATGNNGQFDPKNPDIRYSLRSQVRQDINDAVDRTTFAREDKGHAGRMIEALSPRSASWFRQHFIHKYEAIGKNAKLAAKATGNLNSLLADQSAETAALMSDKATVITAEALGIGNRKGGIPVFKNGFFQVEKDTKGAVEIFAPLIEIGKGDPMIYQYYQFWAGAKRGNRFDAEGREKMYTLADQAYARELQVKFPEFVDIQKNWIVYNNGLVKMMKDSGLITDQAAKEFTKYSDYLPFYRQLVDEPTLGPKIFSSIAGAKPPKKLKGSEAPIADFLETIVRNTQAAVEASMKNVAATRAMRDAEILGVGAVDPNAKGYHAVTVRINGIDTKYHVDDAMLVEALKGLNSVDLPGLRFLAAPANLLRTMVTKDPGFMVANMMRDSLSSWVTSGAKVMPIASTVANFGKEIAGLNPVTDAMRRAGMGGGYDLAGDIEASGREMGAALRKKAKQRTKLEKAATPFTGIWAALEHGSNASEMATRAAVYQSTLDRTGNEAEAIYQAMEVLNFDRRGSSPIIRILTAAVPFLNARIQGLDLLYRSGSGNLNTENAKQVQRNFMVRSAIIFALSAMYWAMTHDDEEYLAQEQETRDNNWLVPSLGIKLPIPFELGIVFKVIPERILEYSFGKDTGKDFMDSMKRSAMSTLQVNFPQAVAPLVEVTTNHSFFTGRPIVPRALENLDPKQQRDPYTSGFAKQMGELTNISPIKIDHLIKGYFGTFGGYAASLSNAVFDGNDPERATLRLEQMPFFRRFMLDKNAKGTATEFYELQHETDAMVRTINILERDGRFEELAEYQQEHLSTLATKEYVAAVNKTLKEIGRMDRAIRNSSLDPDEKRDIILALTQQKNAVTAYIRDLRKEMSKTF